MGSGDELPVGKQDLVVKKPLRRNCAHCRAFLPAGMRPMPLLLGPLPRRGLAGAPYPCPPDRPALPGLQQADLQLNAAGRPPLLPALQAARLCRTFQSASP
jgi:hypothetical protein